MNTTKTSGALHPVLPRRPILAPTPPRISQARSTCCWPILSRFNMKTKNFHWHVSGPHFRDYHLLLDEQADQFFATTEVIAERVRKIGAPTLRSIGDIARHQRIADNDAPYVDPDDMLAELCDDNQRLITAMREAHDVCDEHNDVATASLLENFIDEAERRVWFLYETSRRGDPTGH